MKPICKRLRPFIALLLCLAFALSFSACTSVTYVPETENPSVSDTETEVESSDPVPPLNRVAYLPLDNRPVNKERVQYLAQSVGIELVMPEEDLYRTALDNMTPNSDGSTLGNREALLEWLREVDSTCDNYIISLDQALSGGLVGSRWLSNTDLTLEYEIADEIIELCKNNTVFLFDTVMRLASTIDYEGYSLEEYTAFRLYGQAARKELADEELTVENIIGGYRYGEDGTEVETELSEEALEKYHASRARKLILADYILRGVGDAVDFVYIGVDDSSPQSTIQTAEIRYIEKLVGECGVLSAGTDELGMCCLSRMAAKLYGEVKVGLQYFGPGKDQAADLFDIGTLAENVETHLSCLNVSETNSLDDGLNVLILTRGATEDDAEALYSRIIENQNNNVPTAVIDVSAKEDMLAVKLFEDGTADVTRLLGYSSWNTAGNAIGISLSQSVARYAYLRTCEESTQDTNEGFIRSMTFAYIKDITYKCFHPDLEGIEADDYSCSLSSVLARINEGRIITSLKPYAEAEHGRVSVRGFRYPWSRKFEMTFDIYFD